MIADPIPQAFEEYCKRVGNASVCGRTDFEAGARWAINSAVNRLRTWPSDLHDPPTYRPAFFADVLRKHFGMGDKR